MIETIQSYLYTFYLAGQHESFTKAAQALRISQSAVSIQIKKLEDQLQTTLFLRKSKNKLSLTKAGKDLLSTCQDHFFNLENRILEIKKSKEEGELKITAPSLFGAYILLPFLKSFEKKHPKIKINFHLTDDMIDPIANHIDIALRSSSIKKTLLEYKIVCEPAFAVVAAKDFLKDHSEIKNAGDLSVHTFIVREPSHALWKVWLKSLSTKARPRIAKTLLIDNNMTQIEAVKNGLGLGFLPLYAVKANGLDKKLNVVFPKHKITLPIYACFPKILHKRETINVFVNELKNFVEKNLGDF